MKCANIADECPQTAVATIQFPWDDTPAAACEKHVMLAQQTMTNLARLDELRVIPLPLEDVAGVLDTTATEVDAAPTTPRAAPASPGALELRTLTVKALELELELERARHARVTSELELMSQIAERIESARKLFDHALASVPEFLKTVAATLRAAHVDESTLEGEAESEEETAATAEETQPPS